MITGVSGPERLLAFDSEPMAKNTEVNWDRITAEM